MLLVMAVLGTLLTLVMPLFGRAMEISRSAKCKSNLHSLAVLLHTEDGQTRGLLGGSVHTILTANRWLDFVTERRLYKLVHCPSGESSPIGLKYVWIRQDGYGNTTFPGIHYSNIEDLLAGLPVDDAQVGVLYPAKGVEHISQDSQGWEWVQELNDGQPPKDNEAFVNIATCAAFLVTINEDFTIFKPLGAHPNPSLPSGSAHWILKGDPNEDTWENDVLVRLTGLGYTHANPAVRVFTGDCHYGMSNLVPTRNYLHGQLWLTEYSSDVMRLSNYHRDDPFDDERENGEVMGRHFGFANCVRVDGSVFRMTKGQLETEFNKLDDMGNIFQK